MGSDNDRPDSEREQTDQSLRDERAISDAAPTTEGNAVDETADAVINRARALADQVLAAARAKSDKRASSRAPATLERARRGEDRVVRNERTEADDKLATQRAAHAAQLNIEREETDRDLLSERTRADDAIAMRDEFLGIVSHDLRNLLNNMVLSATLIADSVQEKDHAESVRKQAQRILSSGSRMNRLIGDLVDVASFDAGALEVAREVLDPSLVVAEAVSSFQAQAAAKGVTLTSSVEPARFLAALDSTRILQVLVNLLSNAIKFTPALGQVSIHAERSDGDILFVIRDTGSGIPAQELHKVFNRFAQVTRNDRRGVGLGLYIARCIVQAHGGRIWAESGPAHGTTVKFTLPSVIA